MDEAHLILSTDKQATKEQKDVKAIFVTMRSMHTTTIMCSPTRFTSSIEKGFVDFELKCSNPQHTWIPGYGRGLFQCFMPITQNNFGREYVWHQLLFTGVFGDYPKEYQDRYRKLKRQQQIRNLQKLADKRAKDDPEIIEYYNNLYDELGDVPSPYGEDTGNKPLSDFQIGKMARDKYRRDMEETYKGYVPAKKPKGKRGRPKGVKDTYQRKRRSRKEIEYQEKIKHAVQERA